MGVRSLELRLLDSFGNFEVGSVSYKLEGSLDVQGFLKEKIVEAFNLKKVNIKVERGHFIHEDINLDSREKPSFLFDAQENGFLYKIVSIPNWKRGDEDLSEYRVVAIKKKIGFQSSYDELENLVTFLEDEFRDYASLTAIDNHREGKVMVSMAQDMIENENQLIGNSSAKYLRERIDSDRNFLDFLALSARIHDIGKVFLDRRVIDSDLRFSDYPSLRDYVKNHTQDGYEFVTGFGFPDFVCDVVRYHHENYSGGGYVELRGDQVPFEVYLKIAVDRISSLYDENRLYPDKKIPSLAYVSDMIFGRVSDSKGNFLGHFHEDVVKYLEKFSTNFFSFMQREELCPVEVEDYFEEKK